MRFTYCPHCGGRLIQKEIGDEGQIPFCENCSVPLWDMFTTSVICAVVNEEREVALIRQNYVSTTNHVCVAGIMKLGESAEETAVREIKEETGLDVVKLEYIKSYPYEKKEMLMLGYKAIVKKADFILSGEVDSAVWVKYEDALSLLREGSIAWQLVKEAIGQGSFVAGDR
ncbi:MAG TPA: NUDIX hydrolase [Lachnospiraceae bacterium]|nr:NUDIX hydrolase [Lachnospiraceae bacterium]